MSDPRSANDPPPTTTVAAPGATVASTPLAGTVAAPPPIAGTVVAAPPPIAGTVVVSPPPFAATVAAPAPGEAPRRSAPVALRFGSPPPAAIGPYTVVRELGRGGMGAVYEVRDPGHPERALALKVILDESDPKGVARFAREAEVMARVRHPGVVAVHELGRAAEGPFIVTDLVRGDTLERVAAGVVDPRRAASLVRDIADALAAVHAQGIVHRDVKPQNIMLRADDGRPVLLDFGIARDQIGERLTVTGALLGSPAYMSPEQASGKSPETLDGRADVYGAGAILFELLAGRPPHSATTLMEVLKKVLADEPRWPSADRPATPRGLEAICRMAMARDRMFRYPDAGALRDDLDRYLAGERPLAVEQFAAARRGGRGTPLVLVGALAVGVVTAAAASAAWRAAAPATPPSPTGATAAQGSEGPARPTRPARPTTWAERVDATSTRPASEWPVRGHLALRHVEHLDADPTNHVVRAAFVDDARVVTVGPDRARGRYSAHTWALVADGPQPSVPLARVDLPPPSDNARWTLTALAGRAVLIGPPRDLLELSADGRALTTWRVPLEPGEVLSGAAAPDGDDRLLVSAGPITGERSRVARLDRAGRLETLFELPFSVVDLEVSGRALAAVSSRLLLGPQDMGESVLVVWDLERGAELFRSAPLPIGTTSVALLADRRRVALGKFGGFLQVLDTATSELEALVSPGMRAGTKGAVFAEGAASAHGAEVVGLAVSADGTLWSASGCSMSFEQVPIDDGELRAWRDGREAVSARTRPALGWRERKDPRAQLPGVTSMSRSPDGRALVVGGDEGEANVWILPATP